MAILGRHKFVGLLMSFILVTTIIFITGTGGANASVSKPGLTAVCVNVKTGITRTYPSKGCNRKTEKGVYLTEPETIIVEFLGGSTTPTNLKSISPKYWDGLLCKPQYYKFAYLADLSGVIASPIGKFVTGGNWAATAKQAAYVRNSSSTQSVFIYDNCTTDMIFYACRPAGGIDEGTDGNLNQCNANIRKTTVRQLGLPFSLIQGSDPNGSLTNSAEVIIFYCGTGDKLIAPPASPLVSCIRPQ